MANELQIIISAVDKASATMKKVGGSSTDMAKAFAGAMTGFTAGAAVVAAAGKAIYNFGQEQMAATLGMKDLALKMGTTVGEASILKEMTADLRIEESTLLTAMRGLTSNGLQPNIETLGNLADKYIAIRDPVKQAQFAAENFGARAGPEMRKLLEMGSQGIRDQEQAIKDLGLAYSEDGVNAADKLFEAQDRLNDRMEAFKIRYGPGVMSTLADFVDFTDRATQSLQAFVDSGTPMYLTMYRLRRASDDLATAAYQSAADIDLIRLRIGALPDQTDLTITTYHNDVYGKEPSATEHPSYTAGGFWWVWDSSKGYYIRGPATGETPPPRQAGGPVSEGQPYVVGERGPELFVPSDSGKIVPNDKVRSGVTINVYPTDPISQQVLTQKIKQAVGM